MSQVQVQVTGKDMATALANLQKKKEAVGAALKGLGAQLRYGRQRGVNANLNVMADVDQYLFNNYNQRMQYNMLMRQQRGEDTDLDEAVAFQPGPVSMQVMVTASFTIVPGQ